MKRTNITLGILAALMLFAIIAAPIAAQETGLAGPIDQAKQATTPGGVKPDVKPQSGGLNVMYKQVTAFDCEHLYSSANDAWNVIGGGVRRYCTAGSCIFECNLDLPGGAQLLGLEIDGCDTSGTGYIWANLLRQLYSGALTTVQGTGSTAAYNSGCSYWTANLATPELVDNDLYSYWIEVTVSTVDGLTSFNGVRAWYQLQVSPAPGAATFTDVPTTHPFFRYIQALVASGITSGCTSTTYCPAQAVTREQMAKFLAVGLGLSWSYY